MSVRITKDQVLCVPPVVPADDGRLTAAQRDLITAVQMCSLVADVVKYSNLPESEALGELEQLLDAGWLAFVNPTPAGLVAVERTARPSALPLAVPSTVRGFSSPDNQAAAATQRVFPKIDAETTSRSEQEMDAALARLTPSEPSRTAAAQVGPEPSPPAPARTEAPPPRAAIRPAPIRAVVMPTAPIRAGSSPRLPTPAAAPPDGAQVDTAKPVAERPPSEQKAPQVSGEMVSPGVNGNAARATDDSGDYVFLLGPKSVPPVSPFSPAPSGEYPEGGLHASTSRASEIEGLSSSRSSRPPPLFSDFKALGPTSDGRSQPVALSAAAGGANSVVGAPIAPRVIPRPQAFSPSPPDGFVPGEPVPLIRVTRRTMPAMGSVSPRSPIVNSRDDLRAGQSPLPQPAAARPVPISPAPTRVAGGTLVGGMQAVRGSTPGELPAVGRGLSSSEMSAVARAESDPPREAASPDRGLGNESSTPEMAAENPEPRPRMHRESGRTLVGGSYASALTGTSNLTPSPEHANRISAQAIKAVGVSRMVVVGGERPAAQQGTATATPLAVSPSPGATLLGVRAPDEQAVADFVLSEPVANDAVAETVAEPPVDDASDNLDHFEVIECLAKGGSGVVYRVRDPGSSPGEFLALKVLRQGQHKNDGAVAALEHEATVMGILSHPGLVRLHDFGYEADEPFLLMECIDGLSMSQLLHHPVPLPLDVGLMIIQDTLEVLAYVHGQQLPGQAPGIVHCDVSPQNLLIGLDGKTRLIDFGIARASGSVIGDSQVRCKPRYASPELLAGEEVDPTTDIFAVGAVLFQVLSKVPAFSSDPERRKRESLVPNPSKLNSRAPSRFDPICHRALSQDRKLRFASAREMLDVMNRAVEDSGILLRRERVEQWVQSVFQTRQGEVTELSGEQVKELLGEGRRGSSSRSEPSSPFSSALSPTDTLSETSLPIPKRTSSDSAPAPATQRRSRKRQGADTVVVAAQDEGELPPLVKRIVTGAALVCIVALLAAALLAPNRFGGLFPHERSAWQGPAPIVDPALSAPMITSVLPNEPAPFVIDPTLPSASLDAIPGPVPPSEGTAELGPAAPPALSH